MRRDMDMIREMLIQLGDATGQLSSDELLPQYAGRDLVRYHAWLVLDAGFADGCNTENTYGLSAITIRRLTWSGQDFLAAARDEDTWDEARKRIRARVGDVAVQVLASLLSKLAAQKLGIPS